MGIQSLTPPQDITWQRLAYSRDMIDTNFGDLKFPPKWRSSLAVYYYIVPEEETADAYPNSRIVYLQLTCSITGWNPNEELRNAHKISEDSGAHDDLQKSIWETILSDGWANVYWPCGGAIMQVAVYPLEIALRDQMIILRLWILNQRKESYTNQPQRLPRCCLRLVMMLKLPKVPPKQKV